MLTKQKELALFGFGWLIVLITSFIYWSNHDPEIPVPFTAPNILFVIFLFVVFLAGLFCLKYAETLTDERRQQRWQFIGFNLSLLSFCGLASIIYYLILGLLFAMLVSTFAHYLKPRWAWILALGAPLLSGLYDIVCKDMDFYLATKLLFVSFNALVLLFSQKAKSEKEAKEQANQLLRELQATQTLLESTSKRDERMRIARDLHDSMGHQLTALKLQLELASHVPDEQVQDKIARAKDMSGQLLDHVRQNVTEFRGMSDIALTKALTALTQDIPGLNVNFRHHFNEHHLTTRQAETLFRCAQEAITNIIKHSAADKCEIELREEGGNIILSIQDNGGEITTPLDFGSGLKGMQERSEKLDGTTKFQRNQEGLKVIMTLPLSLIH